MSQHQAVLNQSALVSRPVRDEICQTDRVRVALLLSLSLFGPFIGLFFSSVLSCNQTGHLSDGWICSHSDTILLLASRSMLSPLIEYHHFHRIYLAFIPFILATFRRFIHHHHLYGINPPPSPLLSTFIRPVVVFSHITVS